MTGPACYERCAHCHGVRNSDNMHYIKRLYFCCIEHYRAYFNLNK